MTFVEFIEKNRQGAIFGVFSAIATSYLKSVTNPTIVFTLIFSGMILGLLINSIFNLPELTSTAGLLGFVGLTALIMYIGDFAGLFGVTDTMKILKTIPLAGSKSIFGLVIGGLALLLSSGYGLIIGLVLIAIVGIVIGYPVFSITSLISDNWVLILVMGFILLLTLILVSGKKRQVIQVKA